MTEDQKKDAVARREAPGALAIPEDLREHAGHGTEGIGADDVRPPRLVLAQGGHPQTKKHDEKYIKGLAEGDLFNDLTCAIYDRPVQFVVVRFLGKRAMEFYSDEEKKKTGQLVKDMSVPLTDPRCQPTTDKDGNWVKPVADIFADYLIFLPRTAEIVTLTFKNADLGRKGMGTKLNSLMKYILELDGVVLPDPPAWARTFALDSGGKSDGTYNWAVYTLEQVGVTPVETRKIAASLFESYKAANVVVPVEDLEDVPPVPADEDVPF